MRVAMQSNVLLQLPDYCALPGTAVFTTLAKYPLLLLSRAWLKMLPAMPKFLVGGQGL